ncbi:MAG: hypothetical protein HYW86_00350 [Candidatus Roizmanbacteria bacterium]|nr:MAG: hypothetical protein HYW86_00350 [Candidatus Roizmanbacteria bacterium]
MDIPTQLEKLEKRVQTIENRNKKVEFDKAWETSTFRRILIAFFTYFIIALFFTVIKIEKPLINAIVPTLGFLLSTLSIPFFKNLWMKLKNPPSLQKN